MRARRRAGLSSLPEIPPAISACRGSDPTPHETTGCSPFPGPSAASPGRSSTHPCTPVGLEQQQHEAEAACLRLARLGQMLDGKTGAALQPTIKVQEECRVMGINALRDIQTRDGKAAVGANERALAEADPKVM